MHAVAIFSINEVETTFEVDEQDEYATVCVEHLSSVQLRRDNTLELLLFNIGSASSSDFDDSTLLYTLPSGTTTGAIVCNAIEITNDGIVEDTENFFIHLRSNPSAEDVDIEQANATITIRDSVEDSKWHNLLA